MEEDYRDSVKNIAVISPLLSLWKDSCSEFRGPNNSASHTIDAIPLQSSSCCSIALLISLIIICFNYFYSNKKELLIYQKQKYFITCICINRICCQLFGNYSVDLILLNHIKFFIQLFLSPSVYCTNKHTLEKCFWNHLLSFKIASAWFQ